VVVHDFDVRGSALPLRPFETDPPLHIDADAVLALAVAFHCLQRKARAKPWARIPHFYYNFYVYQYATGFAASEVLAKKVKTEGESAVNKYLNFLKAGSSDYSINILTEAGVDMNSPEPVRAVSERMNEVLDEMEDLL